MPKRARISDMDDGDQTQLPNAGLEKASNEADDLNSHEHSISHTQSQRFIENQSSLIQNYELGLAKTGSQSNKREAQVAQIIDLEDEPDLNALSTQGHNDVGKEAWTIGPPSQLEADLRPDEEFPELARRARERARRKRLEDNLVPTVQDTGPEHTDWANEAVKSNLESSGSPHDFDPTLEILITSSINNTQPLIVSRKLSQRLKDVRLAWTQRQGFTPDFAETVFLTWRGKRLFDVMSCKSLGVVVDSNGVIRTKGSLLGDESGRLHMEAVTSEILEARRKAKEDARLREEQAGDTLFPSSAKAEAQTKIILKGKGHDDFRLRVKSVNYRIFCPNGVWR